jgi:hypothetical protein
MHPMRLFRDLGAEIGALGRGQTREHSKLRNRLATALVLTGCVDAAGTTLMYVFERGKHGSAINSVFTGFFWVSTQLLTVSSQMPNPVTTGGRIVDLVLELWALCIVTAAFGSVAAFFQNK